MSAQLDQYISAYGSEFPYTDENVLMLQAYVEFIQKALITRPVRRMLGLGIGHTTTVRGLLDMVGRSIERLDIVEGSQEIIDSFLKDKELPSGVRIFHGMFESFLSEEKYDAVEMGFILEHVDDPSVVLNYIHTKMSDDGCIFAAVPNALALHRRIGHAAGLLKDPYALSRYDLQLGHQRYYDLESFKALISSHHYTISATKGLLLKPFTTRQLHELRLTPEIYAALATVGEAYPELCNGFAVKASVRD